MLGYIWGLFWLFFFGAFDGEKMEIESLTDK
jgi:hypothetical protein